MKNQIIKKAREIFKDLEFVEDSHTYTVKGKVLPSTSSMIKQFYKDSKKVSNKNMKRTLMVKLKFPTYKHGLRNIFNNFM